MPARKKKRAASMKDSGTPRTVASRLSHNKRLSSTLKAPVDTGSVNSAPLEPEAAPAITLTFTPSKAVKPLADESVTKESREPSMHESSDESDIECTPPPVTTDGDTSCQTKEALLQKVAALEKVKSSMTDLNDTIKKELRKLGEEVESLRSGSSTEISSAEITNLKNQFESEINKLKNENKNLSVQILIKDKRIEEIPTIELALIKLKHEKKDLQEKLTTCETNLRDLKLQMEGLNSPVEKMMRSDLIATLKAKNEKLEEELSQSIKSMKEDKKTAPDPAEDLTAPLAEANATIESLRTQLEASQLKEKKLTQQVVSANISLQTVKQQNADLTLLVKEASSKPPPPPTTNSCDEAVARGLVMDDLRDIQVQINGNETVAKTLRDEIANLGDQRLSLETAVEELSGQRASLKSVVEELAGQRKTFESDVGRLKAEFDELTQKTKILRHQKRALSMSRGKRSSSITPPPNPTERSVFVMRHAERADDKGGWSDPIRPYDTPITAKGESEAMESAKKIQESLASLNNKKQCLLISSPYRRCLETATVVLKTFQASELLVHHGFGEVGSRVEGKKMPSFHNSGYALANGSKVPSFPESYEVASRRAKEAFSNVLSLSDYSQFNIIIVTHGDIVDFCCPKDIYNVETTAFIHMSMTDKTPLELKGVHRVKYLTT